MTKKKAMTTKQYMRAMFKVGQRSFRMAPSIAVVKLIDSVVQATLPVATAYFAAATTTALAAAYAGEEQAAHQALLYVIITALIGLFMMLWRSVSNYISQKMRYTVEASIEDEMMLKLTNLPFAAYDDKDVIDLHEKARRFSYFFSYIFDTISSMLTSVIGAITAIVALLIISPWLSLIVLVAVASRGVL
jgi:ATP-binding cassette subfamily B protein/ATP-binding cassette subfamily C protein